MLFETNTLSRLFLLSEIYMCILLFDALSSVKEINNLISKGMLNIYYWEKLTSQNFDFLGGNIWRNALVLKNKKVQGIFRETFISALSSSAVFLLQNCVSDFF